MKEAKLFAVFSHRSAMRLKHFSNGLLDAGAAFVKCFREEGRFDFAVIDKGLAGNAPLLRAVCRFAPRLGAPNNRTDRCLQRTNADPFKSTCNAEPSIEIESRTVSDISALETNRG